MAAWISALTGVGPSIASGSQTYSGNCADLAERAEHQQERNPLAAPAAESAVSVPDLRPVRASRCACRAVAEIADRPERQEAEHDAEAEAEVADAVDEERLLRRLAGGGLFVVVADQQIRAEADAFPAQVEHDEVLAHHQDGHHEDEQAEISEEAEISRLRPSCSRRRRR